MAFAGDFEPAEAVLTVAADLGIADFTGDDFGPGLLAEAAGPFAVGDLPVSAPDFLLVSTLDFADDLSLPGGTAVCAAMHQGQTNTTAVITTRCNTVKGSSVGRR